MMLKLLELKEKIKQICEKYFIYVKSVVKFFMALIMMFLINSHIGYSSVVGSLVIIFGVSIIFALTPDAVGIMLICLVTLAEVYNVSAILAVSVLAVYLITYFMYLRYVPKQIFVILIIPFLYMINLQYVIPVLCGIMFAPVSAISCAFGVVIYYLFKAIVSAAKVYEGTGLSDTINFYNVIVDDMKNNRFMIYTIIIFAVVVLLTYIVRRQKVKHASYIAIAIGFVINLVSFLLATAFIEGSDTMVNVIFGTIVGALIACVAQFFRMTLDYSGIKQVQFEDDEYYYYVKAIPKFSVSAPDKQVKRIHAQKPTGSTTDLQEAIRRITEEGQ
ncbi:MAG: hypothetical protein E7265_10895 [Lachnospiraceae bacterium]|nr:hypothetical protein [Lachnospiraceae bacterium]